MEFLQGTVRINFIARQEKSKYADLDVGVVMKSGILQMYRSHIKTGKPK